MAPALTRAAAGTALAALALVAGCGGGDETGTTGSSTTPPAVSAQTSGGQATPAIVAAAQAFLGTLTSAERDAVLFDRDDKAQKQRWSNFPEGLFTRQGLMTGNLDQAKIDAFLAVTKATLSTEGYARVLAEWAADDALAATDSGGGGGGGAPGGAAPGGGAPGGPGGLRYGKQYYWIAIIGEPSATESWQWQFGGHHVTVNATVHGDQLSLNPSFIGAQPARYDASGKNVEPLGDIDAEAFALVNSLDAAQQKQAILGSTSVDLVLGPGQECRTIPAEGLSGADMTATQLTTFLQLIDEYAGLANDEDAAGREEQLQTDVAKTSFAWYGPTKPGSAAYFRVTGPHVVIEYSPQSMGGDAADHIHGVYRDPANDYGGTVCP